MARIRAGAVLSGWASFVDAFLAVLGLGLTPAAGLAAVYASGSHLSQPIAAAHIVPLWVIVGTLVTVGVLALQSSALRDGRPGRLAATGAGAVLLAALVLLLGPTPNSSTPVGARLPWLEVSLAGVLLGSLCLLVLVMRRRRRGTSLAAAVVAVETVGGVLVVVLAVALVVGLSVGAARLSESYLDAVNEYHENPVAGPAMPVRSALTGPVAWQVSGSPVPRLHALAIPYGIVVTEGSTVLELDAATGRVRWRYQRSDVDASLEPQVWTLDRGQKLAVRWHSSLFVLDARTGTRIDRWPFGYTSSDRFDDSDPTLQEHPISSVESVLTAVDDHGHQQWHYQQRCHFVIGTRTAGVTLVQASDYCGDADQTLGLDPTTGHPRWVLDHDVTFAAFTDTTAIVTDRGSSTDTTAVSGIDLETGATRWTAPTKPDGHVCASPSFQTQGYSLMVTCVVTSGSGFPHTWALRFDVSSGQLLDQADLGDQVVSSATVTIDGRMVVLGESRHTPTCPITVIQPDGTQTQLADVEPDTACVDTVHALGNQVLVTQFVTGSLEALR